uniref:Actin-related protein 2/3 complex subunit 5 n=1 Tax=Daphnia lumholtzi TaxID=42856 RepID=A0A4Y7MB83_9CRUS|nr:EOG090X0HLA [Daphnia lumholtzi]
MHPFHRVKIEPVQWNSFKQNLEANVEPKDFNWSINPITKWMCFLGMPSPFNVSTFFRCSAQEQYSSINYHHSEYERRGSFVAACSAFRKIDVDQYNEDNYKEDECGESQSPPSIEALKTVLRNAPISSRNQMVKDAALNVVMQVLLSMKSSQIEEAVNALDRDHLDILMKYIYRGFETPSEGSSGQLLAWHEKVHAVAGVGCIVRVLTDKKRV